MWPRVGNVTSHSKTVELMSVPMCQALSRPFTHVVLVSLLTATARAPRTDFSPFFPSRLMEAGRMPLPLHQ